jgi:hypothetical protein
MLNEEEVLGVCSCTASINRVGIAIVVANQVVGDVVVVERLRLAHRVSVMNVFVLVAN